jgi:hypothetical protein
MFGHLHFLFPQTDRPEEANCSYNNDGEKSNVLSLDHLPPITTRIHFVSNAQNAQNDHSRPRFIPLEGCSASYAAQLHMERMFLSMNAYPYLHCNCYWNSVILRSFYLFNAGNCCMLL